MPNKKTVVYFPFFVLLSFFFSTSILAQDLFEPLLGKTWQFEKPFLKTVTFGSQIIVYGGKDSVHTKDQDGRTTYVYWGSHPYGGGPHYIMIFYHPASDPQRSRTVDYMFKINSDGVTGNGSFLSCDPTGFCGAGNLGNVQLIQKKYKISLYVSPAQGGTVSGAGSYEEGNEVSVLSVANAGYNFLNWTESGRIVSSNAIYSFEATAARSLVANFISKVTPDNNVTPDNTDTFAVNYYANKGGYIEGAIIQNVKKNSSSTEVEAIPDAGYAFDSWSDGNTTNPRIDMNVQNDINVTANFIAIIQKKINKAIEEGQDIIEIASGNYTVPEPIIISKGADGITLRSISGSANTILDAECEGIAILIQANNVTFEGFAIKNFREAGIVVHGNHTIIFDNEIDGFCNEDNNGDAIWIVSADDTNIKGNFIKNAEIGILLEGVASRTVISENTITGNVFAGIHNLHRNGLLPLDSTAYKNNIYGNQWGVNWTAETLTQRLSAEDNWWGNNTGPYHSTDNPKGKGDAITNNVNFSPWIDNREGATEEPKEEEDSNGNKKSSGGCFIGNLK